MNVWLLTRETSRVIDEVAHRLGRPLADIVRANGGYPSGSSVIVTAEVMKLVDELMESIKHEVRRDLSMPGLHD